MHRNISDRVIGAAISVHRVLGPGFIESTYENALALELENDGLTFERQVTVPINYRGRQVGEHRLDILVEGALVVELKAVSELDASHFSIVRSYMRAVNSEAGLLLNFASMPLTIKRVTPERSVCAESASDVCIGIPERTRNDLSTLMTSNTRDCKSS